MTSAARAALLLLRGLSVACVSPAGAGPTPAAASPAARPEARATPLPPWPTARPTQPALVIPSPQEVFHRCQVFELEARLISIRAAAGNVEGVVELRNRSAAECDLSGYAGVQLLDPAGRSLPTKVRWTATS